MQYRAVNNRTGFSKSYEHSTTLYYKCVLQWNKTWLLLYIALANFVVIISNSMHLFETHTPVHSGELYPNPRRTNHNPGLSEIKLVVSISHQKLRFGYDAHFGAVHRVGQCTF